MIKYLNKLKLKKGSSMIEFVNVILTFLILFIVSVELFFLGYKHITISSFTNSLTQAISIQGGIQTSIPLGYESANVKYMQTSEVMDNIDSLLKSIGQDSSSLTVKIKYQKTDANGSVSYNTVNLTNSSNIKLDYGNWFEITVDCKLESIVAGDLIPASIDGLKISRTKGGISQFEHDYNS